MIRFFDVILSIGAILVLLPLAIIICIWIVLDTHAFPFFKQTRVGLNGKEFNLLKFRSMSPNAQNHGPLTIGERDSRITKSGYYLRKYKLDEIPQFWNVLKGEMSIVGPRPELPYFVSLYSVSQREILKIKPGLTDEASIYYKNESQLLAEAINPEVYFLQNIVPHKIALNQIYLQNPSVLNYFRIIFKTIRHLLF
ncbi:MAG: sugar transferase [Bacteroidota bacterium]|nr:sugar transferase [Bacteroidota bacterium]